MKGEFREQVVIVTGSGSGIGQALAVGFAAKGAKVVIADLSIERAEETIELIASQGGKAIPLMVDVTKEASVIHMVDSVMQQLGKVDVLVNNAGIVCEKVEAVEVSEEAWDQILDVNLKGTFLCSKHVGKVLAENRKGVIINVGSISGKIPRWRMAPYSVSKAAVLHLTKVMAIELAEYGVRVNAICPGGTITPLLKLSTERDGQQSFDYRINGNPQVFRAGVPLKCLAEPEDHVGAALFLASTAARHITGQEIFVDGGESIL